MPEFFPFEQILLVLFPRYEYLGHMHHGTPFFQGFSSILFGRPALSGLQKTLREVASLNTLFAHLLANGPCGDIYNR